MRDFKGLQPRVHIIILVVRIIVPYKPRVQFVVDPALRNFVSNHNSARTRLRYGNRHYKKQLSKKKSNLTFGKKIVKPFLLVHCCEMGIAIYAVLDGEDASVGWHDRLVRR